ncbi:DMT family transporter [Sinorhizobium fredii]|uniref:DMT family transporter n=1 Tax=Rhizobium fredii TaxID=380 RepID=UPI001AEBF39B|nr:EamA family transporter [Sinorhizobium fredii]WOS66047.1 EamA family transporter [Sinorhizobium fredii GR64]
MSNDSIAEGGNGKAGLKSGPALVALAAMLWGTAGIASKVVYSIEDVPPLVIGFFRLALAVPLLAIWCWSRLGPTTFHFPGRDLLRILALGASIAVYQVFFFAAVPELGAALTALITICSGPVLVGLGAVLFLGETFTRRLGISLGFGLLGAGLLVGVPSGGGSLVGILFAAIAAFAYAVFVLFSRMLAKHDPGKIIVVGFGSGAIFIAPFALVSANGIGTWSTSVWPVLLYIGLIPTALAYLLYFRGMRSTPATAASVLALVEPLAASTLALALFGERLGFPAVIGACFLLVAMMALLRRP